MKWYDVQQNTDEWFAKRAGKVGGSSWNKIMAHYGRLYEKGPNKGQINWGDPAKALAVNIAIEHITGEPRINSYSNAHMDRGHVEEPIACALYEDTYFCDVTNGGFFDCGNVGISPDGIVGPGRIEIKSVIDTTHYETVKSKTFDSKYKWQLLSEMKYTGAEWVDFVSFCSSFPEGKRLFVYRLFPADFKEDFKKMDIRLAEFWPLVEETKQIIEAA